jgi:hypothetical protein
MSIMKKQLKPTTNASYGKISINFPKDLWKELKLRALQDDETVTAVLVRLAQSYLASKRRKD